MSRTTHLYGTTSQGQALLVRTVGIAALTLMLSACSTVQRTSAAPSIEPGATWAVLPFVNHTETPMAGQRAQSIASALLQSQGVTKLRVYDGAQGVESILSGAPSYKQEQGLVWARAQGARYALSGSVDEWRYKVGVDGEPAAGVTLQIIDVQTGDSVWSAVGGKSGWSREALSSVGRKLIQGLLPTGMGK